MRIQLGILFSLREAQKKTSFVMSNGKFYEGKIRDSR